MKKLTIAIMILLLVGCKSKYEQLKDEYYPAAKAAAIKDYKDQVKVENFTVDTAYNINERALCNASLTYYQTIISSRIEVMNAKIKEMKLRRELNNLTGMSGGELEKVEIDDAKKQKEEIDKLMQAMDSCEAHRKSGDTIKSYVLLQCKFDRTDKMGNPIKEPYNVILNSKKESVFPWHP